MVVVDGGTPSISPVVFCVLRKIIAVFKTAFVLRARARATLYENHPYPLPPFPPLTTELVCDSVKGQTIYP